MAGVCCAHHVLGVPHLLRELGHREGAVLLAAAGGEWRKADHEEVQAGEGDQVDRQLAQVAVQLAGEAQAAGDACRGAGELVLRQGRGARGPERVQSRSRS